MAKRQLSEQRLVDYFNEHIFYEASMLRFAKSGLDYWSGQPNSGSAQANWNAMFATFNVSARNLYHFLGSRDGNNMNVADYLAYRRNTQKPPIEDVKRTLELLNKQCLHLGKDRTEKRDSKVNIDRITDTFAWIVSNMGKLIDSFKEDFREKLGSKWLAVLAPISVELQVPRGPSASSLASIITTGPNGNCNLYTGIDTNKDS